MTTDDAIPRRKLSDEILERLLKTIEAGELAAGDKLPSERQLMAKYKVGRPAVREALQALDRMGLIDITHGERARVVRLEPRSIFDLVNHSARLLLQTSPRTLGDLKEARLMFETAMVRIAAARATEADVARLRVAMDRLREQIGNRDRFVAADMAFHSTIASIAGNPILEATSASMLQWINEFHVELLRLPGAEQITIGEHGQIVDCIAAHDVDGAAKAMTDHITRASAAYRSIGDGH